MEKDVQGLTRATPESRARGQRKVVAASAGTGIAALAVTGFLTVGLGQHSTTAATTSTGSTTSSTRSTTSSSTSSSTSSPASPSGATGSTAQQPVATSGGS